MRSYMNNGVNEKGNNYIMKELLITKWEEVKNNPFYKSSLDDLEALYQEFCLKPILNLKYSDFRLFYDTGSRKEYERNYFKKRATLNAFALKYMIYRKNEYKIGLENIIWAICDEYTWALPASIEDGQSDDFNSTCIDLFSAETAQALSEIYYILEDELSVPIKQRIKSEISKRVVTSFINRKFWWEEYKNNWSAVCAGNVGMVFIYLFPEKFDIVKSRILNIMDIFLSGYGDDGACLEGIAYWSYGFGYFVFFAQLLKEFTNDKIDLLAIPKVKEIAKFQQKTYLRKNSWISFSDGEETNKFQAGLTHFLKTYFGSEIEVIPYEYRLLGMDDWCFRFAHYIRSFVWVDPEFDIPYNLFEKEFFFSSAQWYIYKKDKFSFAAKGGHNNEPHNHNDIGSFIITGDSGQILCDLGCGEYTKQYFSEETRYNYLCNSSRGHSVPIINDKMQSTGKEFCAKVLEASDGIFSIELAKAYADANLNSFVRTYKVEDDKVILIDKFKFENYVSVNNFVKERFITKIEPSVNDNSVEIGGLTMDFDNRLHLEIFTERMVDHHLKEIIVYIIELSSIEVLEEYKFIFYINN